MHFPAGIRSLIHFSQDRPDLIESELSGLAFDSLQQIFKTDAITTMLEQPAPLPCINEDIHLFIDPAAGGPQSDYAMVSVTRQKGLVTVMPSEHRRAVHPLAGGALVERDTRSRFFVHRLVAVGRSFHYDTRVEPGNLYNSTHTPAKKSTSAHPHPKSAHQPTHTQKAHISSRGSTCARCR